MAGGLHFLVLDTAFLRIKLLGQQRLVLKQYGVLSTKDFVERCVCAVW
jgi:hypothetical protein